MNMIKLYQFIFAPFTMHIKTSSYKIGFIGSDFNSLYFWKPLLNLIYYIKISIGPYKIINITMADIISYNK